MNYQQRSNKQRAPRRSALERKKVMNILLLGATEFSS